MLLLELFLAIHLIQRDDRMLQFVIFIEAASPPAQLIIVSLNQLEIPDIAAGMCICILYISVV